VTRRGSGGPALAEDEGMRSSAVPVLVILGLASMVLLMFMVVWSIGLRTDLDAARAELTEVRSAVEGVERGVPMSELSMRLAELENDIESWVVAFSEDVPPGASPAPGSAVVVDRLDEVLDRLDALDARLDRICEGVPVC